MLQNPTNPLGGNFPQPLLMSFTVPTRIQESFDETPIYDEINQVVYNMGVVGTKSLKTSTTWIKVPGAKGANATKGQMDKKNEIDDQKRV